jgi:hypothetical protein
LASESGRSAIHQVQGESSPAAHDETHLPIWAYSNRHCGCGVTCGWVTLRPWPGAHVENEDLSPLGKLIAVHRGSSVARDFKAYQMDATARAKVSAAALDILQVFPPLPGAYAYMSAAFGVRLGEILNEPIQVVAGTSTVNGAPVLGNLSLPCSGACSGGSLSWNGHV